MNTLTQLQLHNENQHGFRPHRGTGTATALLYEHLAVGKANGLKMNVVLRDISRAFDKVWHRGLLYKMINSNLPDFLIRLVSDYLSCRKAKIKIGDYVGTEFNMESGVPQGGCLSPTLFNFYTHDTPSADGQSLNLTYADDITQIVAYPGSEKMLARTTAREIEKVN
ncbi:putative RNA-directed DNA polymerase from transposon X-element [Dictyocoela roeselum]|nr:putative RNA-directed DNA polymerase from transposon X-element [Dictyocoela roeselum]